MAVVTTFCNQLDCLSMASFSCLVLCLWLRPYLQTLD